MKYIVSTQIIVVHNSQNAQAVKYADIIYKHFCKDIDNLFELSVGIPVYYFDNKVEEIVYRLSRANKSIIILLVDEDMFYDEEWKRAVQELFQLVKDNVKLIPIGLIENAQNISVEASKINFLRIKEGSESTYQLVFIVAYQILEWLKRSEESVIEISMFLSHEKILGTKYARRIKDNINFVNLRTFFDENNIEPGKDFRVIIEKQLSDSSVVVIIQTDRYSSREWCVREVILAKQKNKTVVLIDFLEDGEIRSFPYIGNVKTIKFNENINHLKLYSEIMKETLRQQYFDYNTKSLLQTNNYLSGDDVIFKQPPELFSVLHLDRNIKRVIYPDPPVGFSELNLLKMARTDLLYQTKSQFIISKENVDGGYKVANIGLSISETEEIQNAKDLMYKFIEAVIEITRYLIIYNYNINYAGDVTYSGKINISELIFDFSRGYNYLLQDNTTRAWNWVLRSKLDSIYKKKMAIYSPNIEVKVVKDYINQEAVNYEMANLSHLRIITAGENHIQIFIGGKVKGFRGYIPGVLEELIYCINNDKPIFLIGGFGGVTRIVVNAITDQIGISEFKSSLSWDENNISNHNIEFSIQKIDFDSFFDKLKKIDYHNGLSIDENLELFETVDVELIQSLILKGLVNITTRTKKS